MSPNGDVTNGKEADVARKNPSLKTNGRAVADKAVDTWNDLASTLETAVGRTTSAAKEAQGSMKSARGSLQSARKDAAKQARKARRDAEKSMKTARTTVRQARKETSRRATATRDALAGRTPRRRWTVIAGIAGVGLGAVAGALGSRFARRSETVNDLERKLSATMRSHDDVHAEEAAMASVTSAGGGLGGPASGSVAADLPPAKAGSTTMDRPAAATMPAAREDKTPTVPATTVKPATTVNNTAVNGSAKK
jgi:ElaB/YqjD/DUF883 family membrane-anchored ribosome-binding protein